jgi:feruloyl esterase
MRAALFVLLALPATLPAADCDAIANLALPNTTISIAASLPAGAFTPPGAKTPLNNLPAFCRVAGSIRPTTDSDIRFEVWLPAEGWNGKFQGIGNGGFAGSISYGGLAEALRHGYASASTDTGHSGGGGIDASWALHHPEKIIDFGHRAIHETTVQGKAITTAFYGSPVKRAYFNSCSNGGRQALMEAQRYPDDYDGIIAGAPANSWSRLMVNAMATMKPAAQPGAYFSAAKLPALQHAALAACDSSDKVADGVIENPAACRFDPSSLLCAAAESDACFTAPQLAALRAVYAGTRDARGKSIAPGYPMGGEAEPGAWGPWITGNAPEQSAMFLFGANFFKFMVYNDSDWDYRQSDPARNLASARRSVSAHLDAENPDLSRFLARGGKLILYHGWSDAAIPAPFVIEYYQAVRKKLGVKKTAASVRLFLVPGMQHCGAGSGANSFGQGGVAQGDPASNISAALERWVEHGIAPERITASRAQAGKITKTRPLCAYPLTAVYDGHGDPNSETSFACR